MKVEELSQLIEVHSGNSFKLMLTTEASRMCSEKLKAKVRARWWYLLVAKIAG